METSRITTIEQLMSLKPRTDIYIVNGRNIDSYKCLAKMPYREDVPNPMQYMAFYRGSSDMISLGKHSLTRYIYLDKNEAASRLIQSMEDDLKFAKELYKMEK